MEKTTEDTPMVGRAESRNILIKRRCLELRAHGLNHSEIAEFISDEFERGYTHKNVEDALKETFGENNELIDIEIVRCDMYLAKLRERIDLGDTEAINSALKISQQRAKLLGFSNKIEALVKERVLKTVDSFFRIFYESEEIPESVKDTMIQIWEKQFEETEDMDEEETEESEDEATIRARYYSHGS